MTALSWRSRRTAAAFAARAALAALAMTTALLGGCASTAQQPLSAASLLHDALFAPPPSPIDTAAVFALSEPMRRYAEAELMGARRQPDPRRALIDALYRNGALRLDYDAGRTRTAAEAFEDRAGNCLSLVIMTAAFARHLDLPVTFQSVLMDEFYTRGDGVADLVFSSGHVNLSMRHRAAQMTPSFNAEADLTVDFLPGVDLRGQRTRPLQQHTVLAMYANNRAAEALAADRLPEAYAWAREALLQDLAFLPAANTLGVIYHRAGHLPQAEAALRHALSLAPDSTPALSNLVLLLQRTGRTAEAGAMKTRLAQLQPYPPFHFMDLGRQALDGGDAASARELFARELRRQPNQSDVHFWAAMADLQLGDSERAAQHLRLAREYSTTSASERRYAGKLAHLRARSAQ